MILEDLLSFLIQSPADFYDTWQNDSSWQDNESTTRWDRSGVWINPEIWIRIPCHILRLAEFALSECSLFMWRFAAYITYNNLADTR